MKKSAKKTHDQRKSTQTDTPKGGPKRRRASLKMEALEPRILLSATWVDADTGASQSGATSHADTTGTSGADTAHGLNGNDILSGLAGDDRPYGQDGNDTLHGDTGNDQLEGGKGHDLLDGGDGNDLLKGGSGDDILSGGGGHDTLKGDGDGQHHDASNDAEDYGTGDSSVLDPTDGLHGLVERLRKLAGTTGISATVPYDDTGIGDTFHVVDELELNHPEPADWPMADQSPAGASQLHFADVFEDAAPIAPEHSFASDTDDAATPQPVHAANPGGPTFLQSPLDRMDPRNIPREDFAGDSEPMAHSFGESEPSTAEAAAPVGLFARLWGAVRGLSRSGLRSSEADGDSGRN